MNNVAIMQERQSFQRLKQHVFAEAFTIISIQGKENVSQGALHQFKDDPVAVLEDKRLDTVDDSFPFVCLHEGALIKHHIAFFLVTGFH